MACSQSFKTVVFTVLVVCYIESIITGIIAGIHPIIKSILFLGTEKGF